jgi:hypothetical protein
MWIKSAPGTGGVKIPKPVQERTKARILRHAEQNYRGRYTRLEIRFRSQFCYIDAYREPTALDAKQTPFEGETQEEMLARFRETPIHLCRLRYHGREDRWSFDFFSYSSMKYEFAMFPSGDLDGTLEEVFDTSALYLDE